MNAVATAFVRRVVEVADGPETPEELLASAGLSADVDPSTAAREVIDADVHYALIERAAGDDDGLPFRYADALTPNDVGALGLALKTADTLREALRRLVRYILVLTDTLEYELRDGGPGPMLVLQRPHHRRGARVANECALAAVVSMLRQIARSPVSPAAVSFRHPRPASTAQHRAYFGCVVAFGARVNALHFSDETLRTRTRLADEGLSSFLLAQLDDLRRQQADRPLAARVHDAVIDALPDGMPRKGEIARRLGMSERTLHRRLAEHDHSFQAIADRARRETAESLLAHDDHSLGEVAFLAGFSDQSAFQRSFKRWTGQTPGAFRETAPT